MTSSPLAFPERRHPDMETRNGAKSLGLTILACALMVLGASGITFLLGTSAQPDSDAIALGRYVLLAAALFVAFFGSLFAILRYHDTQLAKRMDELIYSFFLLVAFLLAMVIAGVSVAAASYLLLGGGITGDPAADPAGVLNLAQVMFAFFGLVLAAATAMGAIMAYWLKQRVDKADNTALALRDSLDSVESYLEATNSTFFLSADMALLNLPRMTFSQQIPLTLLQTLRALDYIFTHQDQDHRLWEALSSSKNGARICYARALYLFGVRAKEPWLGASSVVTDQKTSRVESTGSPEIAVTVLGLLDRAQRASRDVPVGTLRQDVLLRLFQAFRQARQHEKAAEILGQLSEDFGLIIEWGALVLHLQQGYAADDQATARHHFGKAANHAEQLCRTFGSERRVNGGQACLEDGAAGSNVAYYCAKALWAARFCWPEDLHTLLPAKERSQAKNAEDKGNAVAIQKMGITPEKHAERTTYLNRAAEAAVREINDGLASGIEDDYTAAIFYASLAYVQVALDRHPDSTNPENLEPRPAHNVTECIKRARLRLNRGRARGVDAMRLGMTIPIYNDHTEMLDSTEKFEDYLSRIEKFASTETKKEAIWRFYSEPWLHLER